MNRVEKQNTPGRRRSNNQGCLGGYLVVCWCMRCMPMTVLTLELCFELGDTVVVLGQKRQLEQVAGEHVDPCTADADKCGQMSPVDAKAVVIEGWIDQPEHVDQLDGNQVHGDA